MRVGFVAASLAAHLAVVGIAFYAAKVTAPGSPALVRASGLFSVELTQAAEPEASIVRGGGVPEDRSDLRPENVVQPSRPERGNAGAPAKTAEASTRRTPSPKPLSPAHAPGAAPVAPGADPAGDWLSVEQQLPESPQAKPAAPPARDVLVERLLAKEREKARVKAREELARTPSPTQGSSQNERVSKQVPSSLESGEASHASADVWVELTRWLPRAASSDQTWETLPSGTRLDVNVLVRAAPNRPVEVTAAGQVPGVVSRLLDTTAHMMQRGQFAGRGRVERRFALRIRLSQTRERELWIAHTTPDPPKPGVGSFVSPTGRRFDVWVTAEP